MRKNEQGIAELIIIGAIAAVFVGGTATVVVADGSKPGDALYSIDRASESVRESLTFGEEAKAQFKFDQSTERLAELETLRNNDASQDLIDEASDNYGSTISEAADRLSTIAQDGGDIDTALAELVEEATTAHLATLERVYENVPEQAKPSIERAMESSENGTERSLEAINGGLSEERKEQVQERVQNSRALRERSEEASQQGAENAEAGQRNRPSNRGPQ